MPELTKVMAVPILPGLKGTGEHDHCPASANHGLPGAWWGKHVEDPTKSTMFINYETPDAYAAFQRSATCCPELQKAVSVPHEATYDAALSPAAANVLGSAPIVEVARFRLKPETSRDAWLASIAKGTQLLANDAGCRGYAAGFVEGKSEFLVLVGWDSVDAHAACLAKQKADPDAPLHEYNAMADNVDMYHVAIREVMPGISRH